MVDFPASHVSFGKALFIDFVIFLLIHFDQPFFDLFCYKEKHGNNQLQRGFDWNLVDT